MRIARTYRIDPGYCIIEEGRLVTQFNQEWPNVMVADPLKALLRQCYTLVDETSPHRKRALLALMEAWTSQGLLGDRAKGEERRHPTSPPRMAVSYGSKGWGLKDFVRNICAGGVFIETGNRFSVGQQISMVFASPNPQEKSISFTGQVVWTPRRGVGVKLTTASKALQEIIESL